MSSPERPDGFSRFALWAIALGFVPPALLGWFAPDILFAPIGVTIHDAAGYAEIRAAYGGLFGASALLFMLGATNAALTRHALRFAGLVLAGFVFGRLYSLAMDGVPNTAALATLAVETTGLILAVVALRRLGPREDV